MRKIREVPTHSLGYEYWYADQINGAKFNLAYKAMLAWIEMVENKFAWPDYIPFGPNAEAVVVTNSEVIIGLIVFEIDPYFKRARIELGWIHENYRDQGLYKKLWSAFEKQIQGRATVIESMVSSDNNAMNKVAESQKREVFGTLYRKRI
ncbi:MAG: GNAT family N-acetyltransferase [Desulfobulbia bacterium]